MNDQRHPDPADQAELTEQDLAIAALVGRYIERREGTAAVRARPVRRRRGIRRHRRRRAPDRARLLRGDARNRRPRSLIGALPRHDLGDPLLALTGPPSIRSGTLR